MPAQCNDAVASGMVKLTVEDRTPPNWSVPAQCVVEKVKKPLRALLYPPYLRILNPFLRRRYDPRRRLDVDQWYWGHRGFEYERLRGRLNKYRRIRSSSVLVLGCGTGRDVASWMSYEPACLLGVDLFNYAAAWRQIELKYDRKLKCIQGDIANLACVADGAFDIVGSDAVFEHVRNLDDVLRESHRVLKQNGLLYASFGPLWHCFGGDHISGHDRISSGYNHLLLRRQDYLRYLADAGDFIHSEHDGRTWVENDLFSYLKIDEYLTRLTDTGFSALHLGVVVEPRAIKYLANYPGSRDRLLSLAGELDLITAGLSVICRKVSAPRQRA